MKIRLSRCCKARLELNNNGDEMAYCSKCGDKCEVDEYLEDK